MKYCDSCQSTFPIDFTSCPKCQAVLRNANELIPGMVLRDKYEILARIGSGGMATVYRAKHLAFGEERAIKVVSAKLADDAAFLKRFKHEAIVTRKLQHPGAVRVDDLDSMEDGRPFIVMECVEGSDLRKVLEKTGPMPARRALHIVEQVARALAAAHELGITHRDIKPDNILLVNTEDGSDVVKVLDFGIAKAREGSLEGGQRYTATQTGVIIGTPQYMSPEQALGKHGDDLDGRSDIYSLGMVLHELLTGELPFVSETPMAMLFHHIQTEPLPPHQTRPELRIPPQVSDLLMKTLKKDPNERFASASELADALALLAETLDAPAPRELPAGTAAGAIAEAGVAQAPPQARKAETKAPARSQPGRLSGTHPPGVRSRPPGVVTRRPGVVTRPPSAPRTPRPSHSQLPRFVVVGGGILVVALMLGAFFVGRDRGPDDQQIRAAVEATLAESASLDGNVFRVSVAAGVVTLTGEIEAPEDADEAVSLASSVPGVVSVNHSLEQGIGDPRAMKLVAQGQAEMRNGEFDSAISKFEEAMHLAPDDPEAVVARRLADYARAMKEAERR